MEVFMTLSLFLGAVFGWYLLFFSLLILFRYSLIENITRETIGHQPTLILGAMIAFIVGLLLVVGHPVWVWDWPIIITLLGWLILLKGIFLLLFPKQTTKFLTQWVKVKSYSVALAIVLLLVSLFLLYKVYL
jgi:hypothetical protein